MTEDALEAWAERAAIAGEVVASKLLPKGMTSAQAWAEFDRVFKGVNKCHYQTKNLQRRSPGLVEK